VAPSRVALLVVAIAIAGPGCWPGRCAGGFRSIQPSDTSGQNAVVEVTSSAVFWINVDTNERADQALLPAAGVTPQAVVLEGPQGPVPIELTAHVIQSAHSCANAGAIDVKPLAPLLAGDYVLAVLLDQVRWPAISEGDVTSWHGHRALIRRYHVR
jgi:hypothetical protein